MTDFLFSFLDGNVLSGTLTWEATPTKGRASATLYLTLTLLQSAYSNVSDVGVVTIPLPGVLRYGDGTNTDQSDRLTIQDVYDDIIIATGTFEHSYIYSDNLGNPWKAEYEFCCRGKDLQNNRETILTVTADIDCRHSSSAILPTLPEVTIARSSTLQGFFYVAHHRQNHPLLYQLGSTYDYRSSQSGTPQGLGVGYTSGHVTWDTSRVVPGKYSVQVVVVDAFTNIKVSRYCKHCIRKILLVWLVCPLFLLCSISSSLLALILAMF